MKKTTKRFYVLLPVVLTICLYVVFYERIACKPNHAGFWLILVLGISIGVALTRFIQWPGIEKTNPL
jgi:hypothetical protein